MRVGLALLTLGEAIADVGAWTCRCTRFHSHVYRKDDRYSFPDVTPTKVK